MDVHRIALPEILNLKQYFSRNVFVHTHIVKTGGTSFVWAMRSILGEEHVYDTRGGKPRLNELSSEERRAIWLFSGHFWFDTQERPIARRKRYFVIIRDPVDRFVSLYNYVAQAKSHPGHAKYGVLDIEAAFRYLSENTPNAVFNSVCAMFGDRARTRPRQPGRAVRRSRPVPFEEARAVIERNYALVIPVDRIDDAVRRIGEVLGADLPAIGRHNVGVKKVTSAPEWVRRELQERNAEDYKLIAHFGSVFDRHLADLPARLTA